MTVLGLVGSYLGIFFYLRVIQLMFMGSAQDVPGQQPPGRAAVAAALLCLVPVVVLTFLPGWVIGLPGWVIGLPGWVIGLPGWVIGLL